MKFKFKNFGGDSSSKDPPNSQARRKDQVRQAQKTHRERKESYTKSLEAEVVRLRANESMIFQETRRLYADITSLKQLLTFHEVPIPFLSVDRVDSGSENPEGVRFEFSVGQDARFKDKRVRINIQTDEIEHCRGQCTANQSHLQRPADGSISKFHYPFPPPSVSQPGTELVIHKTPRKTVGELDQTTTAIEFVLSLESPCLEHITPTTASAGSGGGISGHSLMVSATLLHHNSVPLEQHIRSNQQSWQASATDIERLLELSNSIPLSDDELTPIQAWDRLRNHPKFNNMEIKELNELNRRLLKHVKCFGFGGVIDQGVFDNTLYEFFVIGRVF